MSLPEIGSHLIDYDANDNPLYEGWAIRKGADMSEEIWRIKRYTWTAGLGGEDVMTEEAYANGNELYNNIWEDGGIADRTTITYAVAI